MKAIDFVRDGRVGDKAIDFVRDGRVGDKVHDIMLGDGVIRKLNPSMKYSVECNIDGAHTSYTSRGKVWHDDIRPRLCWGHHGDLDQGQPPERIDYPLYMKHADSSLVVKFTALTEGVVVVVAEKGNDLGVSYDDYSQHTNRKVWKPCAKPRWKLTKPTWCYVNDSTVKLICRVTVQDQYVCVQGYCWAKAEPCATKDIPDWWPKEWV